MKNSNYLLVLFLSVVLISCKKKNAPDCDCSELHGLETIGDRGGLSGITKNGEPYIGICSKKDQRDSIVKTCEIKNGFLIHEVLRTRKDDGKYITTQDYRYENGKKTGWKTTYKGIVYRQDLISYISDYEQYNKGELVKYYTFNGVGYDNTKDNYYMSLTYWLHTPPNSMKDADYTNYNNSYSKGNLSNDDVFRILDALKKELPHFEYWKNPTYKK